VLHRGGEDDNRPEVDPSTEKPNGGGRRSSATALLGAAETPPTPVLFRERDSRSSGLSRVGGLVELASAGAATSRPGLLGEVVIKLEQQVVEPGVRQKLQGQGMCSLSCRQKAQILIRR
jgi:hypothetical protein